jgi:hypothetical protein
MHPAVKSENDAPFIAVVLFPPAGIRDALIGILVEPVFKRMIRHLDSEPILTHHLGKAAWHCP